MENNFITLLLLGLCIEKCDRLSIFLCNSATVAWRCYCKACNIAIAVQQNKRRPGRESTSRRFFRNFIEYAHQFNLSNEFSVRNREQHEPEGINQINHEELSC